MPRRWPGPTCAGRARLNPAADSYQAGFHRRWGHLEQDHVRALAWLLDSPDLLDVDAAAWAGRVATLGAVTPAVADWLAGLDGDPSVLQAALGDKPPTRLGLYAEKLMAFYFAAQGRLVRHGLQIRANRNDTVGEFDFLLGHGPDALEHIEFATKFYLQGGATASDLDALVGPNLADTLGLKMRKIFGRQLTLGQHPAAQALLPRPVTVARALVKGWLFYPAGSWPAMQGITRGHCRGFWCTVDELASLPDAAYVILPKLQWLAPLRAAGRTLTRAELAAELAQHFATSSTPTLIARVHDLDGTLEEAERGFIVPTTWPAQATQPRTYTTLN